jgi:hypothetical protein
MHLRYAVLIVAGGMAFATAGNSPSQAEVHSVVTASATLNQRLSAVEKKTGYFELKRLTKSKTWHRGRTSARETLPTLVFDVPVGNSDPTIVNVWLTVTGDYAVDVPIDTDTQVFASLPNGVGLNSGENFCSFNRKFAAGQGRINFKVFCTGVVNPQIGEGVEIRLLFGSNSGVGDLTLDGLTATAHIVSQVITEPSQ